MEGKGPGLFQPFSKVPRSVPIFSTRRERGLLGKISGPPKELQWAAEDTFISKEHEEFKCQLPEGTRSTFLMVFSPDGKKIASTHGNHNVYVTDLTNGKSVTTLSGHPRTPWCIAFHPSSNQILASGCLGGQVRVWDLHGGSEIWTADSQTVIASLAFHPVERVLVIASYNELHFWDWSQEKPFAKSRTANEKEKVRFVAFDQVGHKLITGIANSPPAQSQWDRVHSHQRLSHNLQNEQERRITLCYRYMVQQYEQLVERYYDLSRRGGFSRNVDRGTDPMDRDPDADSTLQDPLPGPSGISRRHSAGTDEISASHSSSQFLSPTHRCYHPPESSAYHRDQLWERLNHLRAQVESGRQILATARSATAAITARMSPSGPEDVNYLIENTRLPTGGPTIPPLADLPAPPQVHREPPGPFSRRTAGAQTPSRWSSLDDSSTSSEPSTSHAFNEEESEEIGDPDFYPQHTTMRRRRESPSPPISMNPFRPPPRSPSYSPPRNPPSSEESDDTRRDFIRRISNFIRRVAGNERRNQPTLGSLSSLPRPSPVVRPFREYREIPTDAEFIEQNRLNRTWVEVTCLGRLRDHARTLQATFRTGEYDPQALDVVGQLAERRLHARLVDIRARPRAGCSHTAGDPEHVNSPTNLGSIREGVQILRRCYDTLSKQCRARIEVVQLVQVRRLWDELQSQISSLREFVEEGRGDGTAPPGGATEDSPRLPEGARGPRASSDSGGADPSANTDDDSLTDGEGSSSGAATRGTRRVFSYRRLRFLQRSPRSSTAKRARYETALRVSELLNKRPQPGRSPRESFQATSPGTDEGSDDTGEESSSASTVVTTLNPETNTERARRTKSLTETFTVEAARCRQLNQVWPSRGRMYPRVSRYRLNLGYYPSSSRFAQRSSLRGASQSTRDFSSQTPPNLQEVPGPSTSTGLEAGLDAVMREFIRRRARDVLFVIVDALLHFFDDETYNLRRLPSDILNSRLSFLSTMLNAASDLCGLVMTQMDQLRRENDTRGQPSARLRARPSRDIPRRTLRERRVTFDLSSDRERANWRRLHSISSNPTRMIRLPILRVNDGPVPPESPPPLPRDPADRAPSVRQLDAASTSTPPPQEHSGLRRLFNPRMNYLEESTEDSSSIERDTFNYLFRGSPTTIASVVLPENYASSGPHHRIQSWDFSKCDLPDLRNAEKNIVVKECKIHNDASVDVSKDGSFLVTLLPPGRLSVTTMLGIYSLQWETLGQCLYTTSFEQNAVSVALSPTTRHLIVGLATRRIQMFHTDRHLMAQVFLLEGGGRPGYKTNVPTKGRLALVRDLEIVRDTEFMSLNCIRWMPSPGSGLVYGTNTGHLAILR